MADLKKLEELLTSAASMLGLSCPDEDERVALVKDLEAAADDVATEIADATPYILWGDGKFDTWENLLESAENWVYATLEENGLGYAVQGQMKRYIKVDLALHSEEPV